MNLELSVVVVSFNVRALLERCLASILAAAVPGMEVFVVDNASADGSADLVRKRFPQVTLVAHERNVGFGAANNVAIRRAAGRYVALVNPDCEVQGDSLARLIEFMDAHPRAAVAGGRLRYADGAFQHGAFRFPSLAQVFLDVFPFNWRLAESALNGRYPRAWDERAFPIDHPLGAFFVVRRSAIEHVGLFDEGYFMYAEEVDWCYRFKQAGWEVWHCPDALAIHHGGRSTRQHAGAMFVQLHRSRLRFYRQHYPRWFEWAARGILWLGIGRLAAGEWLGSLRDRGRTPERRERVRACLEVLRL